MSTARKDAIRGIVALLAILVSFVLVWRHVPIPHAVLLIWLGIVAIGFILTYVVALREEEVARNES